VKEKINLGPTTMSLGVNPLKNPPTPSFFVNFKIIDTPDSGELNGLFWMRVYAKGAEIMCKGSKVSQIIY